MQRLLYLQCFQENGSKQEISMLSKKKETNPVIVR